MRFGIPVYQRAAEKKRVFVTIEPHDTTKQLRVVLWRGWKVADIRKAAKKAYPDCHLSFGTWF